METVAEATTPVVYQALLEPKLDWRPEATMRIDDLERNADTIGQQVFKWIVGDIGADDEEATIGTAHEHRIEAIETKDSQRSFAVHARAAATGENAHTTLTKLEPAFEAPATTSITSIRGSRRASRLQTRSSTSVSVPSRSPRSTGG